MQKQLAELRKAMKKSGVDAYLIPTTDFHGSEYVNEYFKCREYVSGFTGSAGTLLVTADWAGLWTDGRYFLQAEAQLDGSGIELMKEKEPGVPTIDEYLHENLPDGSCLGFDGRVVGSREAESYEKRLKVRWDLDLAGEIWRERPALKATAIYEIPVSVTGETAESKLARVRAAMEEAGADMHLITGLEEAAWLFHLRGNDVVHTPVFFAFVLMDKEGERLYVLDESFAQSPAAARLPETTRVAPYFQFFEDIRKLRSGKLLLNPERASCTIVKSVPAEVEKLDTSAMAGGASPAELMKAIKNETEIKCTKEAHIRDGAAVTMFIYWLKSEMGKGTELTETDAAKYLTELRGRQKGFRDVSFSTISAYGPNGAIVHYDPSTGGGLPLRPEGFLLVDSGGQYDDGTTDITRTIALGPLSEVMKEHYTLVLKSHIALAAARFAEGADGAKLDEIARKPLREKGLDYNHGTGHGVGHLLSVHEGPNSISPRGAGIAIREGMITSDEPGLYLTGKYGIRLENEILCVRGKDGLLEFEPLTWCPWEPAAIKAELLTEQEKEWLNSYHRKVYEKLSPLLDRQTAEWLKEQTKEIH